MQSTNYRFFLRQVGVFVHSRNQLPESQLQNQALLQSWHLQSLVIIRRVRIRRLPSPYESRCRDYTQDASPDQPIYNQLRCLQRCRAQDDRHGLIGDLLLRSDPKELVLTDAMGRGPCPSALCPPGCSEEHFKLRNKRVFSSARNQLFIQLDEQIDVIQCRPIFTYMVLIFYALNQLSIAFGWNVLLATNRLARLCSSCLRFRRRAIFAKTANIFTFLLLLHQTVQLAGLYSNFSTITNTEINVQTMQKKYLLTVCLNLDQIYFSRKERVAYIHWFYRYSLQLLLKQWEDANTWLLNVSKNRRTVANLLSQEEQIKNHILSLRQSLLQLGYNVSNIRNEPVRMYKKRTRSLQTLRRYSFAKLLRNTIPLREMIIQPYNLYEGVILGASCLHVRYLENILTGSHKCYRMTLSQYSCRRNFIGSITSLFSFPFTHLYLDDGIFEPQSSRLDNLRAVVEERRQLLASPYSTDCQWYPALKTSNNISCSSQAECINVCMIERSIQEYGELPIDLPFLWPKYSPLLGPWHRDYIRFSPNHQQHEAFRPECQQKFRRPDCVRSRFFNEFRINSGSMGAFRISFFTRQTKTVLSPKYTLVQFIIDLMGLLSLCVGMSLLRVMRNFTVLIRRVFERQSAGRPPLRRSSSNSHWIRFLLLLGLVYQVGQLVGLYRSKPVSTQVRAGTSVNSVLFVPNTVLCFPLAQILIDPVHVNSTMHATFKQLQTSHFSAYNFKSVAQIINATLDFGSLVLNARFLVKAGDSYEFKAFTPLQLRRLERIKRYKTLQMNVWLLRDQKCFSFKNGLDRGVSRNSPVALLRFPSFFMATLSFFADNLNVNMFEQELDGGVHVVFSYQLMTFQNSVRACQNRLQASNLFDRSGQMQRDMLLKFGAVQTLLPLDDRFFHHPIDNRNLDVTRKNIQQYLNVNRKVWSDAECELDFRFRVMNFFR